jgi:hypothetical protein
MEEPNIIGYIEGKTGAKGNVKVVATVEIPKDALTDLTRTTIKDKFNATYSTNKLEIKKIVDEELNEYEIVYLFDYVQYKLNDIITRPNIKELNFNLLQEKGMYFYLSKNRAINNIFVPDYKKTTYFYDGYKHEEFVLNKYGSKNGKFMTWDENGNLIEESNYCLGNRHGEYKKYNNGIIVEHYIYTNGRVTENLNTENAKKLIHKKYYKMKKFYNDYKATEEITFDNYFSFWNYFSNGINKINKVKNNKLEKYKHKKVVKLLYWLFEIFTVDFIKNNIVNNDKYEDLYDDIEYFLKYYIKDFEEKNYNDIKLYLQKIKDTVFI